MKRKSLKVQPHSGKSNSSKTSKSGRVIKSPSAPIRASESKTKEGLKSNRAPSPPVVQSQVVSAWQPADEPSGDDLRIHVAVRIRPLIVREKGDKVITTPRNGNEITLEPPPDTSGGPAKSSASPASHEHAFTFDSVFGTESTQCQVYEQVGSRMVSKMEKGFSVSLICYGQTGAGKTWTMTGDPKKKGQSGLMYRAVKDIQSLVEAKSAEWDISLEATFLEIYNEHLFDLLVPRENQPNTRLQIREDAKTGVFVQNVKRNAIESLEDFDAILEEGNGRRTVGETKMNAFSSRSHSVLSITMTQQQKGDEDGFTATKSTIHMVDLAGSERADSTGAKGKRLKEGAQINQSLSALGNVISALVDQQKHIPYRNSKLTRLLSDSLGGNSMTLVIANISPSATSFQETLSTLRFANRAKQIKNAPKLNIDPKVRKIRELQKQLAYFHALLGACPHCACDMVAPSIQCDGCQQLIPVNLAHAGMGGGPPPPPQKAQAKGCCTIQ